MVAIRIAAVLSAFQLSLTPAEAQTANVHLIPIPREVRLQAEQPLPNGVRIVCASCSTDSEDRFTSEELAETLAERRISVGSAAGLTLQLNRLSAHPDPTFTAAMKPEGYTIGATANPPLTLTVTAETAIGLFYGAQTLKQLIEGSGSSAILHPANIRDWPAMKYRGLHDDLSRGPVPTLEFQKHLIRTLAAYKVNIYSPYFEHTQQYASNPLPAPPGGSISAADAQAIVSYARQFHITVIPEQEAFGHLRHTLIWEQYQPLAETPHGAVLAPAQPGSLDLIKQWFTELAALYPGPFLHIGADETVDLGVGQTKPDVDARGLAAVYLDFLQRIVTALQPLHRKILFWGDIAQDSPALLKALPRPFKEQTIAVAWGYSPNPRGFEKALKPFTDAGIETWVAPSINNYRQVYPNQQLALDDIQQFTRDGQRFGATGQLNTLWNDDGESLAQQNWYGILFGAAAAWQPGESSIAAFQQSYAQVFHGDRTGLLNQAQQELTSAMTLIHDAKVIGATEGTDGLFWVDPWSKDGQSMAARMRPIAASVRLDAERSLSLIAQAKAAAGWRPPGPPSATGTFYDAKVYGAAAADIREPAALDAMELGARRIDFLGLKFQLTDEMVSSYARAYVASGSNDAKLRRTVSRELSDINGVNGRIQDIKDTYAQLRDIYEAVWLSSNRPSGLRPILEHYDYAIATWLLRMDRLRDAQRQWTDTKSLPAAADLGMPGISIAQSR